MQIIILLINNFLFYNNVFVYGLIAGGDSDLLKKNKSILDMLLADILA